MLQTRRSLATLALAVRPAAASIEDLITCGHALPLLRANYATAEADTPSRPLPLPPPDTRRSARDYEAVMAHLHANNARHLMRDVINEMHLNGVLPTQRIYHTGLTATAEAGLLPDARFFWWEMKRHGARRPGFRAYVALFDAYMRAGKVRQAAALVREMPAAGLHPGRSQYLALLTAYSMAGRLEAAGRVAAEMRAARVPLYQSGYAALIGCYARCPPNALPDGFVDDVMRLLEEEREEAAAAGHRDGRDRPMVVNAAMGALVAHNKYRAVAQVYERAVSEGVVPDGTTHFVALQGYLAQAMGNGEGGLTDSDIQVAVEAGIQELGSEGLETFVKQVLKRDASFEWMLAAGDGVGNATSSGSQSSSDSSSSDDDDEAAPSSSSSDSSSSSSEEETESEDDEQETHPPAPLLSSSAAAGKEPLSQEQRDAAMRLLHDRALTRARSALRKQILAARVDGAAWTRAAAVFTDMTSSTAPPHPDAHLHLLLGALDLHDTTAAAPEQLVPDAYDTAAAALDGLEQVGTRLKLASVNKALGKACRRDVRDLGLAHRLFALLVERQQGPASGTTAAVVWRYVTALLQREPERRKELVKGCELILGTNATVGVPRGRGTKGA